MRVNARARWLFYSIENQYITRKWNFFFKKIQGSTFKNGLKEKLYILIVNYLLVDNRLKTRAKKNFAFNPKETKVYLQTFSFTFLQSEGVKTLNNNTLIIFEKNGVGTTPSADSIRALRPDFQVPFLALTFLFKVWHSFGGLFVQNRTGFVAGEAVRSQTDFARIHLPAGFALSDPLDDCHFILWQTRLCGESCLLKHSKMGH